MKNLGIRQNSSISLKINKEYRNVKRSYSSSKLSKVTPKSNLNKNSPNKNKLHHVVYKEYTDTEVANLDDVQKIKKLFLIYTNNEKNMSSQKFLRLLLDAEIIDKNFDIRYADILYITENKSKLMNFQGFCEILVKISEIKFPNDFLNDENKCLNRFLNKYLFPLLNKVISPSKQFFIEEKIQRINFDNKIKEIIEGNSLLFKSLYEKYFPWENLNISNSQKKNLSFKSLEKFLFEFEICPNLVSRNKAIELFEEILLQSKLISCIFVENNWNSLKQGTSFTCLLFIIMIYLISICNNFNCHNSKIDEYEFFCMIIEKILSSPALKSLNNYHELIKKSGILINDREKSLNKSAKAIDPSYFERKKYSNNEDSKNKIKNKNVIYESIDNTIDNISVIKSPKHNESSPKNINYFKLNSEDNFEIDKKFIEKHKAILLTIYKYFCNITNCTNQIFLNYSSFVRLMKDCNLLETKDKEVNHSISSPFKLSIITNNKNHLSEQMKKNVITYNQINLLFSKFSSESDHLISENLNNKQNYTFYKSQYYKFKTTSNSPIKDHTKGFTNKKISFTGFMKILICISNKLFNPIYKEDVSKSMKIINNNQINIDCLLNLEPQYMYKYVENFISLYFVPIYIEIKNIFENEFNNFQILHDIINNENIVLFVSKFNSLLQKIFNLFTDDRKFMFFEEYLKFCKDFDIFPDYIQKNRIYTLFIQFVDNFDSLIIQGNPNFSVNYEKFVALLLFCSIDSNIGGVDNYMEKVILFFEKMLQSEGMKRCTKLSGNGKLTYDFNNILVQFKSNFNKSCNLKMKSKSFKEIITKN